MNTTSETREESLVFDIALLLLKKMPNGLSEVTFFFPSSAWTVDAILRFAVTLDCSFRKKTKEKKVRYLALINEA